MATNKETSAGVSSAPATKGAEVSRAKTPTVLTPVLDSPFEFVRRFAEQMDHIFEDFTGGRGFPTMLRGRAQPRHNGGLASAVYCPPITVRERDNNLVIHADLPGLAKDDVKIDVVEGMITIEGERKEQKEEKSEGQYYSECSYGSFSRSIPLPEGADVSAAKAKFQNGVLEISVPMPKQVKPETRRLEIQDA